MKTIKKFNEWCQGYGDEYQTSWAGSSWAFRNPEIPKDPKTEPIPLKQSYPYKCLNCEIEYYFMKEDGEPFCSNCGSDDSEPLTSINVQN